MTAETQLPYPPPVRHCDICTDPGRCCKDLFLSLPDGDDGAVVAMTHWSRLEALVSMAANWLPFLPTEIAGEWFSDAHDQPYYSFRYTCPELLPGGRCGIYEDRPDVCRNYTPGQDPLCVFHPDALPGRRPMPTLE